MNYSQTRLLCALITVFDFDVQSSNRSHDTVAHITLFTIANREICI